MNKIVIILLTFVLSVLAAKKATLQEEFLANMDDEFNQSATTF